jgi:hypothetical protein
LPVGAGCRFDWTDIPEKYGATSGANNKRYSRMMLAWEVTGGYERSE